MLERQRRLSQTTILEDQQETYYAHRNPRENVQRQLAEMRETDVASRRQLDLDSHAQNGYLESRIDVPSIPDAAEFNSTNMEINRRRPSIIESSIIPPRLGANNVEIPEVENYEFCASKTASSAGVDVDQSMTIGAPSDLEEKVEGAAGNWNMKKPINTTSSKMKSRS